MHNPVMTLPIVFTKMHGAGNDFVVLDGRAGLADHVLQPTTLQRLADRRFGVGADQILVVESSPDPRADFVYRIFNADGQEVEQCGNGARCFARYVIDHQLAPGPSIRVLTKAGLITPTVEPSGDVTVDMGRPDLRAQSLPFLVQGLATEVVGGQSRYALEPPGSTQIWFAPVSMGNPHLVTWVSDLDQAPVAAIGSWLQSHERLPQRVNVGFGQVLSRNSLRLRVFERGAGETLACGTGACAAVVSGVAQGLLQADESIEVQTRGGLLHIRWPGTPTEAVSMTGPAVTVFTGEIHL